MLYVWVCSHPPSCHQKYHEWMASEELRELTASEPLTLEEEYEMQSESHQGMPPRSNLIGVPTFFFLRFAPSSNRTFLRPWRLRDRIMRPSRPSNRCDTITRMHRESLILLLYLSIARKVAGRRGQCVPTCFI